MVWHFQSLLEHAIAQSFESERLTLAVNWYLESDEHEQSAHSDPSAASGSASPTGGFGIGIAYAIFVNAMHAQAVADVTTAQFESTGRVSLALGAAKFGVIDYLSPEVVCSEAQSVSCGYGSTEYEKCTLSEAADGSVECTKLGTLTITRQPGEQDGDGYRRGKTPHHSSLALSNRQAAWRHPIARRAS